jgi:pSer/pThr/pTyr-binding forkhead associated (FHA) protein
MKAKLIERGPSAEQTREIPITESEFLIGRATDCDLRLRSSEISRHHCEIRIAPDGASVNDLGSSNGTYVNDQRVRSQADLHSGDLLKVGPYTFLVDLGDQPGIDRDMLDVDPITRTLRIKEVPKR